MRCIAPNKTLFDWLTSDPLAWYKLLPTNTFQQKYLLIAKLITAISNNYPLTTAFKLRITALTVFQLYDDQLYAIALSNMDSLLRENAMSPPHFVGHFKTIMVSFYKANTQFSGKSKFDCLITKFKDLISDSGCQSPFEELSGSKLPKTSTSKVDISGMSNSTGTDSAIIKEATEFIYSENYELLTQLLLTANTSTKSFLLQRLSSNLKERKQTSKPVCWNAIIPLLNIFKEYCLDVQDAIGLSTISNCLYSLLGSFRSADKQDPDIFNAWIFILDVQLLACKFVPSQLIPKMSNLLVTKVEAFSMAAILKDKQQHFMVLDYLNDAFNVILDLKNLKLNYCLTYFDATTSECQSDIHTQRLIDSASRFLLRIPDIHFRFRNKENLIFLYNIMNRIKTSHRDDEKRVLALSIMDLIWNQTTFDENPYLLLKSCYSYFCLTGHVYKPIVNSIDEILKLDPKKSHDMNFGDNYFMIYKGFNLYSISVTNNATLPFKLQLHIIKSAVGCIGKTAHRVNKTLMKECVPVITTFCKFLDLHGLHQMKVNLLKQVCHKSNDEIVMQPYLLELSKSYHNLGLSGKSIDILEPLVKLSVSNEVDDQLFHGQVLVEYAMALLSSRQMVLAEKTYLRMVHFIQSNDLIKVPLTRGKQQHESISQFLERAALFGRVYLCSAYLEENYGHRELTIVKLQKSIRILKTLCNKLSHSEHCIWPITTTLLDCLHYIARSYDALGIIKETKYYIEDAIKLARTTGSTWRLVALLSFFGQIYIRMGDLERSQKVLHECEEMLDGSQLNDINFLEFIFSLSLFLQRQGLFEEEKVYYEMGETVIAKILADDENIQMQNLTLDLKNLKIKGDSSLPTESSQFSYCSGLYNIFNRLLRSQFFSLGLQNLHDEAVNILNLKYHPVSSKQVALLNVCKARYNYLVVKQLLSLDPFYGVLQDSALSMPSIAPISRRVSIVSSMDHKKVVSLLSEARQLLLSQLNILRECSAFDIANVTNLLNHVNVLLGTISSSSVTANDYLCLEMAKARPVSIDRASLQLRDDNYSWPGNHSERIIPSATESVIDFHKDIIDYLPENWLVVSLNISDETGNLVVSKFVKGQEEPFILNLPLTRHNIRDADEESYSFEAEYAKLHRIIEESNLTAQASTTSRIESKEDKTNWWQRRFALDKELEGLLNDMEYRWLGGFKGVMNSWMIDNELSLKFQDSMTSILNSSLPSRCGGKAMRGRRRGKKTSKSKPVVNDTITVDSQVFELFLGLGDPDDLSDPGLFEDLIYFVLDILQFHGEQNAYDELDIDQLMVDIEEALRKYHNSYRSVKQPYEHVVLVLDKKCQQFPWESIPLLKNQSTSRVTSLSMLRDLLTEKKKRSEWKFDNIQYILNPSGDLMKTQERLEHVLSEISGSSGIVGRPPSEDEFADALANKELLIYVGHGGGEQYIRGSRIKGLGSCSPALLLGCSSGSLELAGDYESWGTPVNYITARCPLLVANMWDVTDKDIDKFSIRLLELMGLLGGQAPLDIAHAVVEARNECMLRYLNGASPVIYGLP